MRKHMAAKVLTICTLLIVLTIGAVADDITSIEAISDIKTNSQIELKTNRLLMSSSTKLTINELKSKFPNGKYWNHAGNPGNDNSKNNQNGYTSTPCSVHGVVGTSKQTCNGFQPGNTQVSWQCMGFAEKLGYDYTGLNPRTAWATVTNSSALDNLKTGDIVRYKNNGHSIFVVSVSDNTVTYADCNSDGHCKIRWGATISKSTLKSSFTYVRQCPGKAISSCSISLNTSSYTYDGSAKKPTVTVKYNSTTLKKDTDYSVSYSNNTNAGTATVTVKGKGDYVGSNSKKITIKPKNLSASSIKSAMELDEDGYYKYTGYERGSGLFDGSKELKKNTDYTVSYKNNLTAGSTMTATFTGKGNYTGTKTSSIKIEAKAIGGSHITTTLSYSSAKYTGSALTPTVTIVYDPKDDGTYKQTLKLNTDYTVSYKNNVNAGTASVVITGKGNFQGTATKTFTITGTALTSNMVSLGTGSYTYDGTAKKPAVTVKNGSTTLKNGTDYSVAYSNNTNVGTATVTITGKGGYKGAISKTFTIAAKPLTNAAIQSEIDKDPDHQFLYTGYGRTSALYNGNTKLKENTDYTVSYKNNINVGTMTATYTGKGNYSGTKTSTIPIVRASLNSSYVTAELAYISTAYTGQALTPAVTVKYNPFAAGTNIMTLKEGTDYTLAYSNNTEVGTASVTITGKGNFSKSLTKTFAITDTSQDNSKVAQIHVDTVSAAAGETVTVPVSIKNNLGLSGFTFSIDYDASVLTLTEIGKGQLIQNEGMLTPNISGKKVTWYTTSDISGDGILLQLTFTIAADAAEDDYAVCVSLADNKLNNISNSSGEQIAVVFESGAVSIQKERIKSGDVTEDGDITIQDVIQLARHQTGLIVLQGNALKAGDVTGDGDITIQDVIKLARYAAGLIDSLDSTNYSSRSRLAAYRANDMQISVDTVNGTIGNEVRVPVTVTNNSGIAGLAFSIDYNKDVLELTGIETGAVLSDNGELNANIGDDTFIWYNTTDVTADGVLATLVFTVKEAVANGKYPITVELKDDIAGNLSNAGGQPVTVEFTAGAVTICDHSSTHLANEKVPTCTERGYSGDWVCDDCDTVVEAGVEEAALGHESKTTNVREASCTEDGYTGDVICAREGCGATIRHGSVIPAAHEPKHQGETEATCTETGYTGDEVCVVCGQILERGDVIEALGHTFDEGIITKEATESEDGEITYTCKVCGATEIDYISYGNELEPVNPEPDTTITFIDVPAGEYFAEPVNWAVAQGITNGTGIDEQGNNYFSPDASCTRAQAVTFLWRAAGQPEPSSANNPFTDVPAGEYYYKAVLWAVEQRITKGVSDTEFSPNTTCNRAQIVTFLHRYEGEPKAEGQSFNDVPANEYYYAPVIWAVSKGVTNGTGGGNFSPMDDCTRGQIVTFLYRDLVY